MDYALKTFFLIKHCLSIGPGIILNNNNIMLYFSRLPLFLIRLALMYHIDLKILAFLIVCCDDITRLMHTLWWTICSIRLCTNQNVSWQKSTPRKLLK